MRLFVSILVIFAVFASANLELAPQNFTVGNSQAVFIDINKNQIDLKLDVKAQRATAITTLSFYQPQAGYPVFDLIPNISKLVVDGKELSTNSFPQISDPTNTTNFRIIREQLAAGHHTAVFHNRLGSTNLRFSSRGVKLGLFMSDLSKRRFLEQYFPTNLEYDQYTTTMNIDITGASYEHRFMSNGALTAKGVNKVTIQFPDYFTTSSYYLHIVDPQEMHIIEANYQGMDAIIPLTVYARQRHLATSGMANTKKYMKELENTYGAYAHAQFVAYITPSGGGMEHCGATITSMRALGHEITHSWFARGVMGATGNAGWMDEAIASWRDRGYPRPSKLSKRTPVNLGNHSQYRRTTTYAAYSKGMTFISELDYIFRNSGGMKQQLRQLYARHKRSPISTPIFQQFMQSKSSSNLLEHFDRYVFGKNQAQPVEPHAETAELPHDTICRPFTREELDENL